MPLDDIFHEKPTVSEAERLKVFWRNCAIVVGSIVMLSLATYYAIEEEGSYFLISISVIFLVGLPILFIAYPFSILFSYIIPYYNFSDKEKADIYFYIIVNLLFLTYVIFVLDEVFYDSAGIDWLFGDL